MNEQKTTRAAAGRTDLWRYDHILTDIAGAHLPLDRLHETFAAEDMIRRRGCGSRLEGQMRV